MTPKREYYYKGAYVLHNYDSVISLLKIFVIIMIIIIADGAGNIRGIQ